MRKTLMTILALCFQVQVMALIAMPCAQAGSVDPAANASGCHQSDSAQPSQASHLTCVKCTLSCVSAGFQLLTVAIAHLPARPYQAVAQSTPADHYYRFVYDSPPRPPIASPA